MGYDRKMFIIDVPRSVAARLIRLGQTQFFLVGNGGDHKQPLHQLLSDNKSYK